jgi:hypothetical protein
VEKSIFVKLADLFQLEVGHQNCMGIEFKYFIIVNSEVAFPNPSKVTLVEKLKKLGFSKGGRTD